jgi:hypothetical protein
MYPLHLRFGQWLVSPAAAARRQTRFFQARADRHEPARVFRMRAGLVLQE